MTRDTSSPFFRGSTGDEEERFIETLQRFDRHGCSILVTGADRRLALQHMQLALGGSDAEQILVSNSNAAHCLPDNVDADDDSVKTIPHGYVRSAAVVDQRFSSPENQRLSELRRNIWDAVDELDSTEDLRVAVDSVEQLFDEVDPAVVDEFIEDISRYVQIVDGRVHFYLQKSDSSDLARRLTDHVDARIELRDSQQPEHRWHLPDEDITTDWVDL